MQIVTSRRLVRLLFATALVSPSLAHAQVFPGSFPRPLAPSTYVSTGTPCPGGTGTTRAALWAYRYGSRIRVPDHPPAARGHAEESLLSRVRVLAATVGLRRECIGTLRLALHEGLTGLVAEQVRPVSVEQVKNLAPAKRNIIHFARVRQDDI